jgi:leucyl-tRNA synthetase
VSEKDLPLKLPYIKNFKPLGTGKSPLANYPKFFKTKCPKCKGKAIRETDVSDTFLDSAWYYLRYPSARLKNVPFDQKITRKWLPVDMYIGGAEHSVLHLLYSRFICFVLKDLGFIHFEEPFKKFRAHGLLISQGAKMSKSRGNVINPDEYLKKYGADTLRMYLMFLGPFEQGGDFRDEGIIGIWRFLKRVWALVANFKAKKPKIKNSGQNSKLTKLMHQTIKKVTEDIENLRFNTAISQLMIYQNALSENSREVEPSFIKNLILLLAPFAPHISEELWQRLRTKNQKSKLFRSIFQEKWPKYDPRLIEEKTFQLVVQINGKTRDVIEAKVGILEEEAKELALKSEKIKKWLEGREIKKTFYLQNKLINFLAD